MKTRMTTLLVKTSSAIAVALVGLSFTLGAPGAVRADDPQGARPEMVLISAMALDGLEQRVSYLEGVVASLAESPQRVSPHQLCVSDETGAETCVTKAQLDALLASQAPKPEVAQSTTVIEGTPAAKEEAAAIVASNPEPSPVIGSNETSRPEPETTGSIAAGAAPAAAPSAAPDIGSEKSDELP
jgi:hypothetical protein